MIGEKILGYTVDEKIGSGGFGTVYRVSKKNASGTYVRALKHITLPNQKQYADVLNSMGGDFSKADDYFAGVLNEIVNEIQIISTLSEAGIQNIVRYYENDIVETKSPKRYDIYILMECLTPFTDYLYQNELKVSDVIKLGKDILTALISCHEHKVIHRDIKDDNIFVSADGTYKLGDFGVSKMLKDRAKAESMKGTPNFIAPEVYLGKEQYDETVDVYSLGIVLYKLLNKMRNPFLPDFPQQYNSNDEDLAFEMRMKGETPKLPFEARNALGEAIVKSISKRSERFDSAKDFLEAIVSAENALSQSEKDIVVNHVIPQTPKAQPEQEVERKVVMDKTIGIDNATASFGLPEKKREDNLFKTVSDTFNKIPTQTESVVKIKDEQNYTGGELEPSIDKLAITGKRRTYSEEMKVEAIKKSDFRWIAYLLPVIIGLVYVILFLVIIPKLYGKTVGLGKWAFTRPEEVVKVLEDESNIFIPIYKIVGIRIGMYVLWMAFIASLFNFGRVIANKKPELNVNAILKNKEAYLLATEIYDSMKNSNCRGAMDAKNAMRGIVERLRIESVFGYGEDSVVISENDIVKCLKEIEGNVPALYDESKAKEAGNVVVADCKVIQSKLKIRAEMKKKRK